MATVTDMNTSESLWARIARHRNAWLKRTARVAKKAGGFIKRAAKWVAGTAVAEFVVRNSKKAGGQLKLLLNKISKPVLWIGGPVIAFLAAPKVIAFLIAFIVVALVVLVFSLYRLDRKIEAEERAHQASQSAAPEPAPAPAPEAAPEPTPAPASTIDDAVAEAADLADRASDIAADAASVADTVAAMAEDKDTKARLQLTGTRTASETLTSRRLMLEEVMESSFDDRHRYSEAVMRLHVITIMSGMGDGKLKDTAKPHVIFADCKANCEKRFPEYKWNFHLMHRAAASEAAVVTKLKQKPVLQPV